MIDSFTVSLSRTNSRHLPLLVLDKGTVSGLEKWWKFCPVMWAQNALQLRLLTIYQPITKHWCQWIGGHVTYPTDSFTYTCLWLFSSLVWWRKISISSPCGLTIICLSRMAHQKVILKNCCKILLIILNNISDIVFNIIIDKGSNETHLLYCEHFACWCSSAV